MASVESISVAQLKAAIKEGGLDFAGLMEKPELVVRAREALERSAAGKAAKQDAGGSAAAKPQAEEHRRRQQNERQFPVATSSH
ncbi:hypothetical protein DIPPA_31152 [Diplonema papillatum]|nr:hypothetical protein DIPPA_31152 [Diplonema papillatum]